MSYISYGSGPDSRNAQHVVHQCVAILYAMRVFFLHHTLQVLHSSRVDEPERLSKLFLNSQHSSSFTSIQNMKRPAKLDIPEFGEQKITWVTDSEYKSLLVHCGVMNLDRVPVSHSALRATFNLIITQIRDYLKQMAVECINYQDFVKLKDSSSSTRSGEGMLTFNPNLQLTNLLFVRNATRETRIRFLAQASIVYRLALAAIHLSGGPSPRGTEDAVTRLTNSSTELVRNVQLIHGTVGVASGCVVCKLFTRTYKKHCFVDPFETCIYKDESIFIYMSPLPNIHMNISPGIRNREITLIALELLLNFFLSRLL